jgi:hypothetical protein
MSAPQDEERSEGRGRVDAASLLYIAGGIPAIIAYIVLCFVLARLFDFPA